MHPHDGTRLYLCLVEPGSQCLALSYQNCLIHGSTPLFGSVNFAEALLQDQLCTAVAALVAAISNQSTATTVDVSTGSGAKRVDYLAVNESHSKFGDHSNLIVAQVMDGYNLANSNTLFQAGNVRVVDILGRVSVVVDAPALYSAAVTSPSTPAKRRVVSLVAGTAMVTDSSDIISNIETSSGKERIETTLQIDYTFGLRLKVYTWDETNGGKSPIDAELATGSNWDKVATSIKHTAGTLAIGLI